MIFLTRSVHWVVVGQGVFEGENQADHLLNKLRCQEGLAKGVVAECCNSTCNLESQQKRIKNITKTMIHR